MSLLELFCHVDDFWMAFAPAWKQALLQSGQIKRQRHGKLAESEIMTILSHLHQVPLSGLQSLLVEPH